MDFADLRVFRAVVDAGGVSAAAKKLHRVQSNVTTRIRQLEASLGAELFVRERRRLHLSPAGELFLGYADQMLALAESARDALQGDVPRGALRVGTMESIAAARLPPLLSRYHRRHPAVRMEIATGTSDALVQSVLDRSVEAAFVADCGAGAQLEAMPAFDEELVVVAPRPHPPIRSARDVRADTIISFPAGCAYRRRLQGWLGDAGERPQRALELASYHAIVACVASGAGIAIVPRSVLRTVRAAGAVAAHSLPAKYGRVTTALVWRRGEISPALKALQRELASARGQAAGDAGR